MGTEQQGERDQGAKKQEMGQKAGRESPVTQNRVNVGSGSAQSQKATAGHGAELPPGLTRNP